jgi:hypothetical protein
MRTLYKEQCQDGHPRNIVLRAWHMPPEYLFLSSLPFLILGQGYCDLSATHIERDERSGLYNRLHLSFSSQIHLLQTRTRKEICLALTNKQYLALSTRATPWD